MNGRKWNVAAALCALLLYCAVSYGQAPEEITYREAPKNVFEGYEKAAFKFNYFLSNGYSHEARYWYEIVIADELTVINFRSPRVDDWNFISYQKQIWTPEHLIDSIKTRVVKHQLTQGKAGLPNPDGSGYTAENLFIESASINLAGGSTYMNVGAYNRAQDEGIAMEEWISREKKRTSSISGDVEGFVNWLLPHFPEIEARLKELPSAE